MGMAKITMTIIIIVEAKVAMVNTRIITIADTTNGNHNGQNQHHHAGKKYLSHIQCFKCKKMGH